jgi:hypothetical protein
MVKLLVGIPLVHSMCESARVASLRPSTCSLQMTTIFFEILQTAVSIPSPSTTPCTVPSGGSLDWIVILKSDRIPLSTLSMLGTHTSFRMTNAFTGGIDPGHLYSASSFDIPRWDGLVNGSQKSPVGVFIVNLVPPGAPLVCFLCSTTPS